MPARSRSTGFTLIEVLVALAIVGMVLAAIAGVFSNGLLAHETAADAEAALALAEEKLALAGASHPGSSNGTYAGRFAWQTTVSPYTDSDKSKPPAAPNFLPVLYRIAVSVVWPDGRRSREVALSTLRLGLPQ